MLQAGYYYTLKVLRLVEFGVYVDDGGEGILLPKRFVPKDVKPGDEIRVFLYHDSDNRLIATTQEPKGIAGDIVELECVAVTSHGAFLDWGLMKDLFVAKSQQKNFMRVGAKYKVKIYIDERTGRIAATEKTEAQLSNENITLKELEPADIFIDRKTDLGYAVIINNMHTGLLHDNDIFKEIQIGDKLKGYIKKIRPDNKIDVALGKPGYQRVEGEEEKILRLLNENDGYLPYHDKSDPEDIYAFFGMSKKVFKMASGALYKQRKIEFTKTGIRAVK